MKEVVKSKRKTKLHNNPDKWSEAQKQRYGELNEMMSGLQIGILYKQAPTYPVVLPGRDLRVQVQQLLRGSG